MQTRRRLCLAMFVLSCVAPTVSMADPAECVVLNPQLLQSDRDYVAYDGRKAASYEICIESKAPPTQIVTIMLDKGRSVILQGGPKRACKDVESRHIRVTTAGATTQVEVCPPA